MKTVKSDFLHLTSDGSNTL